MSRQSPSNSQKKAIRHGTGPMLVLAGPGSGKTFVMIQRVLYLIEELHIPPENILVISFSKASAIELKERFQKQTEEKFPQKNDWNHQVSFSTFHACFFHILKEYYHYSVKDILQEKEKRDILKIILTDPVYEESYTYEKAEEYLNKISYYKNCGKKAMEDKETPKFKKIFQAYNQEIHALHRLDFDDMGILCYRLLLQNQEILEKWRDKFQYILIDEYQDINKIQFMNIQLLAARYNNLFVVGDDDQAIYGFRGANPEYMLEFKKYYPQADQVLLETNFRCAEPIVKAAKKVIEENTQRFCKEIVAFHKGKGCVCKKGFENRQREYQYIEKRIRETLEIKEVKIEDMACIYRTNQDMTGLADFFVRNKIPFAMKEKCSSIFQHFIALDIMAYLDFFMNGKHRKDFLRIMNKPLRYISRNSLTGELIEWEKLKEYYGTKNYMIKRIEELRKNEVWIQKLDLYGAVYYIRKVIGYENYLKEEVKRQQKSWEEAKEILDFIHESTKGQGSLEEWKDAIRDFEEGLQRAGEKKEGIQLITMHGCKGLEFHTVFLPDCNEGRIPHKKAKTKEELEEERRMFYVAMTRAKEQLEILYIEDKMKKHLPPTRFLK